MWGESAQRMGYSSVQHFSKQFRQWVGYSPSAYARQFAKGPQRLL